MCHAVLQPYMPTLQQQGNMQRGEIIVRSLFILKAHTNIFY